METDFIKMIQENGEITDRAESILQDLQASYNLKKKEENHGIQSWTI